MNVLTVIHSSRDTHNYTKIQAHTYIQRPTRHRKTWRNKTEKDTHSHAHTHACTPACTHAHRINYKCFLTFILW
jgi:hypothetical protein